MSEDLAIRLRGVGKRYKVFSSRQANLLDALGLARGPLRGRGAFREYWALRDIDLDVGRGQRVGVIGRNGAGKSTLLKLITQNIRPTEGMVEVNGSVQALIEAGAGFHPEFTGRENLHAALVYQGYDRRELMAIEEDVREFTELDEFFDQPLKTYSLGMQARLAFATATTVRPELLVVDEVLGAGDAYFIGKSLERIRQISDSGASMLIVSHSLSQIVQLCESAIWLDRGRIVESGTSLDVVKAYERHIRELEDRRLQARNAKRRRGRSSATALDSYDAILSVELRAPAPGCEVAGVSLLRAGETIEHVAVGGPQDANPTYTAHVVLAGSDWSDPATGEGGQVRRLAPRNGTPQATGSVVFALLTMEEHLDHVVRVRVNVPEDHEPPVVTVRRDGESIAEGRAEAQPGWQDVTVALAAPEVAEEEEPPDAVPTGMSHWPGEGSLRIAEAELRDAEDQPRAVFARGSSLRLAIAFEATVAGRFEVQPCAVVYRQDGINVTTHIADALSLELEEGDRREAVLELPALNLGDGTYVVSLCLYRTFDPTLVQESVWYDIVDRSIEFQVVGGLPGVTSLFEHPSTWDLR